MIEIINRNEFLKKLFPKDGFGMVFFGQIGFDVGGRVTIGLHVKNKPAIEVGKWGEWGVDYNVIVVEVLGYTTGEVVLRNQFNFDFADVLIAPQSDGFLLTQEREDFFLQIPVMHLVFQRCTIYQNSFDE